MKVVIKNGTIIDPKNKVFSKLNLIIKNGKISRLTTEEVVGDEEIDATGLFVVPGFVDIHMHEDKYDPKVGKFDFSISSSMLKMGVTTAIGGNCGIGTSEPGEYLDAIDKMGFPINLGLFIPHEVLRKKINVTDKYSNISSYDILKMKKISEKYLDCGCMGISFGIQYVPGITTSEIKELSSRVMKHNKIISAHIGNPATKEVILSLKELVNCLSPLNIPIQISHIGSMAAFGYMEEFLSVFDEYHSRSIEIMADCYPYTAFCTNIGSTSFDEGFHEKFKDGYACVKMAEGKYKGQRLNEKIYHEIRNEDPNALAICHSMIPYEVNLAITHPHVAIASDGVLNNFQGHPRASGTFPRLIGKYVREDKLLSLNEAIEKITYKPAKHFGLSKGSIGINDVADIVIFDYNLIIDNATFEKPILPPSGIKYVLINGEIALEKDKIIKNTLGKSIRK